MSHISPISRSRFGRQTGSIHSRPAPLWLIAAAMGLTILVLCGFTPPATAADAPGAREPLTVDAFSVVRVHVKAVPDARSRATLGPEREGTGIVIDSSGLILTIGYLIQEADTVQSTPQTAGRCLRASSLTTTPLDSGCCARSGHHRYGQ
jgi:S1-C subfamily serine protease